MNKKTTLLNTFTLSLLLASVPLSSAYASLTCEDSEGNKHQFNHSFDGLDKVSDEDVQKACEDLISKKERELSNELTDQPTPPQDEDDHGSGDPKHANWDGCLQEMMTKKQKSNIDAFKACSKSVSKLSFQNVEPDFTGSTGAIKCQRAFKVSGKNGNVNWQDIAQEVYRNGSSSSIDYTKAVAVFIHEANPDEVDGNAISAAVKNVTACNQVAAAFGENFSEDRQSEDQYQKPEKLTSIDGRITCKLEGLETLDYDECSNLVLAHNAAQLGKTANATFQQFQAQDFSNEQQNKLMNMDGTENVTTTALKSQKDGLAKQQSMAETRRTIEAARLGTILTMSSSIPTSETYFETNELCKKPVEGALTKIQQSAPHLKDAAGGGSLGSSLEICQKNFGRFGFLRNGDAKRAGNQIAAEAGVDVAKEQMAISQLGKQQKMISNAIGKIEGMDTMELPEDFFENQDVYMEFCQANPAHAQCQSGWANTVNVPSFGDYSVGGFGTNQAYQHTDQDQAVAATAASTDDPTSAGVDTSTVVNKAKTGGGLKGNFGPAATVSEGGQIAQGAGGGGSSPGGGGGGGGSSAGDAGQPEALSGNAGSGLKGISYVGGRGPSFVGGRGTASVKKKNNGNPFSNMFKKNQNRNLSSLNFKGKSAIGSKSDNIFQRISTAYDKANDAGNLLKYETKTLE
ncbi:hypothetical protein M902_2672 [Bacteriovorax sp. BAL6_X]|uniref:hypothetical protein n=1 Tax=Bacteriovorax sp. BAL6_X TaxID=1201290 RepID=UPI000386A031|nr:hypothetical protein [Bacteriovorax sp. BAL6_X]EPZ50980.1 hypothetical protein M902_2672 [Bacteriovorax sp. BAL6_X]